LPPSQPITAKLADHYVIALTHGWGGFTWGSDAVTVKNIVIPLETEYLQQAAKQRGISRTRLVKLVMEKVVEQQLVAGILEDDDQPFDEPRRSRYRRFPERHRDN
jgi:hypothetical protein